MASIRARPDGGHNPLVGELVVAITNRCELISCGLAEGGRVRVGIGVEDIDRLKTGVGDADFSFGNQ